MLFDYLKVNLLKGKSTIVADDWAPEMDAVKAVVYLTHSSHQTLPT